MKFVTYILDGSTQPRFGFKKNEYIIDVIRAAIWAKETQSDLSFLEIPSTLKKALENWDTNFLKLKKRCHSFQKKLLMNKRIYKMVPQKIKSVPI